MKQLFFLLPSCYQFLWNNNFADTGTHIQCFQGAASIMGQLGFITRKVIILI